MARRKKPETRDEAVEVELTLINDRMNLALKSGDRSAYEIAVKDLEALIPTLPKRVHGED